MTIIIVIIGGIDDLRSGHSPARNRSVTFSPSGVENEEIEMDELFENKQGQAGEERERRRVERAAFETDRQLIEGDLTLPPAGYQSRFSDSLNRGEFEFLPLTNVQVTSLTDGKVD